MSVSIKVTCPVCAQGLEYVHEEGEAWGTVNLTDHGTVELTAHDKGQVIGPHMQTHRADGSWAQAVRQRAEHMTALVERLDEAEKELRKIPLQEVLAFAENGSRVGIFAESLVVAQSYLDDITAIWDERLVEKTVRVHGKYAMHFRSGGVITFNSTRSVPRGRSYDRLYVPANVRHDAMLELAPLVQTSKEPAIVGYL